MAIRMTEVLLWPSDFPESLRDLTVNAILRLRKARAMKGIRRPKVNL